MAKTGWAISLTGIAISLGGIGVSIYLTYTHYASVKLLGCPEKGLVNCSIVTTSSYSKQFGIPLAVLGLAFFVVTLGLQLPMVWRSTSSLIRYGRLALTGGGTAMALWLVWVELFRLDHICLYCTAVHILTFLAFVVTAVGTALTAPLRGFEDVADSVEDVLV
jgi:uncharacterized membrane protein